MSDIGAEQTIANLTSNWVQVEVQTGAKDRDGKPIAAGTTGWVFGGINVENELGGINIKCKNLKCEGEAEVHFATKKAFTLTTDDTLKINPKGNANITSDKEVKLKGKDELQGGRGNRAFCGSERHCGR